MAALLAACVLVPLFLGFPRVLDDSRLDGGVLGLLVLVATGLALWRRPATASASAGFGKSIAMPAGSGWILTAFALGGFALFGLPWNWVVSGLADRMPLLAAWALMVLAYSFAHQLNQTWRWLFRGCAVAAGYNLLQLLGWDPLGLAPAPDLPPTMPMAGRAHAAELLTVFVVAGAAWHSFTATRQSIGHWLLLFGPAAFMAGYFDLTAGRLAMVLGLAWLVWQQRHKLAPAAMLLALFVSGETTRMISAPPFAVQDEGESGLPAWASVEGRSYLYQACLSKASSDVAGIGWGRFERDYPRWRSQAEQELSSSNYENITSRRPKTPHSEPLLILVESGWLGLAAAGIGVALLLFSAGPGGRRMRWTTPAIAALAVHAAVRSPFSDNGPLLALSAVLFAQHAAARFGLSGQSEESAPSAALHSPSTPWVWRWIPPMFQPRAWIFLGLVSVVAVLPAPAQFFGELAVANRIPLTEEQPPEVLEKAVEWRAWDSRAWGLLAVDYSRVDENPRRVEHALSQALYYDPTDLWALNSFFKLEMTRARVESALQLLAIAEAYSPQHPAIRANRTTYLRSRADHHRLNGLGRMKQNQAGAHVELRLAQLFKAIADIRDGSVAECRKALKAAAFYSKDNKGLIERIARAEELTESKVHALLIQVQPDMEIHIGPQY